MALTESIKPALEEARDNNILIKRRPKPEIIISDALQKSIEIISKFDYKFTTEENVIEYKTCFCCKNGFPTILGKNYYCQICEEILCVKHRNILSHNCKKLDPNLKKYLAAKKLIKEKMRMRKLKGN